MSDVADDVEPLSMSPVKPGDLLAGKYRVQQVLGQGAMGVVVAAVHEQLGQKVALKFLLPEALQSEDAVARFSREARAMVKIQSEHIARVTDVGQLETGAPYTVMEFLQGRDLGVMLEEQGPLKTDIAVDYVLQACEAIAEAHAVGIIHRDLKPSNLFLARRADGSPLVKVLDFGIAKSVDDMNGAATNAGTLLGSPYYMSPEQLRSSHNVDLRSDIWALGVILFELLTGRPVFLSETMPGLCGAILTDPATPLRELLPTAPEGLEIAILRCLERDLTKRFQNVSEFARAIAPFALRSSRVSVERISRLFGEGPLPDSIPPARVEPAPAGARTTGPWAETQNGPGGAKRSAGMVGLVAVALLVAVGATALVVSRHDHQSGRMPSQAGEATAKAPPVAPGAEQAVAAPALAAPAAPILRVEPQIAPTAVASVAPAPSAPAVAAPSHGPRAPAAARPHAPAAKPTVPAVKSTQGGTVDPLDGRK